MQKKRIKSIQIRRLHKARGLCHLFLDANGSTMNKGPAAFRLRNETNVSAPKIRCFTGSRLNPFPGPVLSTSGKDGKTITRMVRQSMVKCRDTNQRSESECTVQSLEQRISVFPKSNFSKPVQGNLAKDLQLKFYLGPRLHHQPN